MWKPYYGFHNDSVQDTNLSRSMNEYWSELASHPGGSRNTPLCFQKLQHVPETRNCCYKK